ncbi:ATP-binding protein [Streptococcus hyovaginalis]
MKSTEEKIAEKFISWRASELRASELIDETCDIHGTKKRRFPAIVDGKKTILTMCDECTKDGIAKKSEDDVKQRLINSELAKSYYVFTKHSIVPSEFKDASFDNFEIEAPFDETALNFAKRMANHYFKDGTGNTVLTGKPGLGKSHLTFSMAKGLNETFKSYNQKKTVIFMPVSRLITKIKGSFNGGSDFTQDYAIDLLSKVDVLVLDDLGKESTSGGELKKASSFVYGILFDILDGRDKTIINTNFTREELRRIYDDALVDRIFKGAVRSKQVLQFPDNLQSKRY